MESVIRNFIKNGDAVSSKELYQERGFGVKPATIRAELNKLTKQGYLRQPHTSGGRVPTDAGYRFFVENLISDRVAAAQSLTEKMHKAIDRRLGEFIDEMSGMLNLLGVGYGATEKKVYKSGLEELVAGLDTITKPDIFNIVSDFEHVDERIKSLSSYLDGQSPKVFIGKSPITRSENLSVVADVYNLDGEKIILAAIGPKRMNYQKVIGMFKMLKDHDK